MKRGKLLLICLVFACISLGLLFFAWAANPPAKEPKLPAPPPKLFEDGTPWKAVDQEAALEHAREVPEFVEKILEVSPEVRRSQLGSKTPGLTDVKYR